MRCNLADELAALVLVLRIFSDPRCLLVSLLDHVELVAESVDENK